MEREDTVAAVVSASGGKLVGKVRLQKAVYLMDQLGLESNFSYEYHYYGPYSRDLDNAVADAKAFGVIVEREGRRMSDGAPYSIFELAQEEANPEAFGELGEERARELAELFAQTNVTVLELAATIDWLWRYEGCADWKAEVTKRKGVKVQDGRLEKAVELLDQLGLAPPVPQAA